MVNLDATHSVQYFFFILDQHLGCCVQLVPPLITQCILIGGNWGTEFKGACLSIMENFEKDICINFDRLL